MLYRPDERPNGRVGNIRRLRLRLDPSQYYYDVQSGRDCYSGLNLVVRRHSKQNNFRPILETIRDLLNAPCGSSTSGSGTGAPCGSSTSGSGTGAPCGSSTSGSGTGARCGSSTSGSGTGAPCGSSTSGSGTGAVTTKTGDEQRRHHDVPRWLHDLFLGYGAPNSAHYRYVEVTVLCLLCVVCCVVFVVCCVVFVVCCVVFVVCCVVFVVFCVVFVVFVVCCVVLCCVCCVLCCVVCCVVLCLLCVVRCVVRCVVLCVVCGVCASEDYDLYWHQSEWD